MQIRFCFIFAILISFCSSAARADEKAAATAVQTTINYIAAHPDLVWPEFPIATMPIVVQFAKNLHTYAYNFKPESVLWKPQTLAGKTVYFVPDDGFNFEVTRDDFQTLDKKIIYYYQIQDNETPDDIIVNMKNLVEKRFANYLAKESTLPRGALDHWTVEYTGFNQMEEIEYSYLEYNLLRTYLLSNNIDDLKDYLAIHHVRYNLLNKPSKQYEDIGEIYFGVSAYVSYQALNLNKDIYTHHVMNNYENYLECPNYETISNMQFCLSYAMFQLTGPILGTVLDKDKTVGSSWKRNVMQSMTTPVAQLEKLYPMDEKEINQRVAKDKQTFHFEEIQKKTESKLKHYLGLMRKLLHIYVTLPDPEINLDYRYCMPTEYSTKFREQFDLSNNQTFFTYYTMQFACHNNDTKTKVQYTRLPFLIKNGSILNNQFKVPPTTVLTIDGVKQTIGSYLTTNKSMTFKKLELKNEHVNVVIEGKGEIKKVGNAIRIATLDSLDYEFNTVESKNNRNVLLRTFS